MWTCPRCQIPFRNPNQAHSCLESKLDDFFVRRSPELRELFGLMVMKFNEQGEFVVRPAKTMMILATDVTFGFIDRIGTNFINGSLVFHGEKFDQAFCFHRIGEVPGEDQRNHYFRLYGPEDITPELLSYFKLARDRSLERKRNGKGSA